MTDLQPTASLDARYSGEGAMPTPWSDAESAFSKADIYWLSSVRPDGRPHVTPMIGVWSNGALYFCTGPQERKALNLVANAQVTITTGTNDYDQGLDVVVEGRAIRVTDRHALIPLIDAYVAKYGEDWRFTVGEDGGGFGDGEHFAWVFRVEPVVAFGFGRGEVASQTRWRFTPVNDSAAS